ncbi:probable aldehyde dehydrogenase, NAD(P) dependent family [Psychrobacter arcticus 273-4]|uniref:Putative NAD(P)H nitroreductase n=1 Tax=Psychrobacter arcticus (strain DSM 17307 / VKM B-2377 / 273-4) TaxID=259536 RepID=Q4FS71_PSYA2|nr:nitroreductase [Psychrobacter arcticus]AAZ19137.1 probable aldehyde dehydrogenase, NAD(P) dependent family [Psychrobacter arcticus 273-4]
MSISEEYRDNNSDEPNNTESPIVTNSQVTDEQLINWIKSRRSIGNLSIPAPTESQIKAAIDCAVTAPDHKKLQPWRFIVTQGNARHELGRAFLAAAEAQAAQTGETLSEKSRQQTYNMPLRAPVIITVVTQMQAHKKVPPFEQVLSVGAAVQNLILALKAQGFSTVWRTGLLCNEPAVKAYFDVDADDYVTAFVYTGSSPCDMPTRKPIDIEPLTRFEQ